MEPRLAANYRHFTMVTPHDTKVVHPHAIPYGSYDEDTMALILVTNRTGAHGAWRRFRC